MGKVDRSIGDRRDLLGCIAAEQWNILSFQRVSIVEKSVRKISSDSTFVLPAQRRSGFYNIVVLVFLLDTIATPTSNETIRVEFLPLVFSHRHLIDENL